MVDFDKLPRVGDDPKLRLVDGTAMTREQYETEGWHIVSTYVLHREGRPDQTMPVWRATLEGLQRYAALRAQRRHEKRVARQARDEEDESFRRYIDSLGETK